MGFVFSDISKLLKSLNPLAIAQRVFSDPEVSGLLIDAIQLRLKEKGLDASGDKLRTDGAILQDENKFYSNQNIEKANKRWVDLYSEGDFYDSFKIKSNRKGFVVSAEFDKPDGENVYDHFQVSYRTFEDFEREILAPVYDEYFQDWAEEEFLEAFFEVITEFLINGLSGI